MHADDTELHALLSQSTAESGAGTSEWVYNWLAVIDLSWVLLSRYVCGLAHDNELVGRV